MPRRILPVEDERAVDFVELAWRLHRDDPHWIPPLQGRQLDELTGDSPFFRHGRLRMFLCEERGEPVGRVAALVDDRLPRIGQVGYFEAVDDDGVAGSLFRAAADWLREQGAREVLGPMDGGMHRPHRLMTRGFTTDPFLHEPRNPPCYARLFETHGFVAVRHWHGYDLDGAGIEALCERLRGLIDRSGHDHRGLVARAEPGGAGEGLDGRAYQLLSAVGSETIAHVSATLDEWGEVLGGLTALLGEHALVTLRDRAGALRALVFQYPDYGREVHALNGDDAAFGRWNRLPQSRRTVIHTAAGAPGSHEDEVLIALEHAASLALEDGYRRMAFAPQPGEPRFFRGIAEPDREYALYGRPL